MKRGVFEIACAAVAAVILALFVVVDDDYQAVVFAGWFGTFIAAGSLMVLARMRVTAVPPERRPQRFVVTPKGFVAPHEQNLRHLRGTLLLVLAGVVGMTLHSDNPFPFFLPFVGLAPIAMGATRSTIRDSVILTPAGVTVRDTPVATPRTLAWGEPLAVPRDLAINPWFVSAAIHWYANHPDERAAIGTPEGHDRLREALGAVDPVRPPRPPLPANLVLASWLVYAGVAVGVLAAVRDVVLVTVFRSAVDRAYPPDLFSGASWVLFKAVAWFFVVVVAGMIAVGLLAAVRRGGNDQARIALAAVAGAAVAFWLPGPIDGQILRASDVDHQVGVLILHGWLVVRLALSGIGLATLILLATAPVRQFSEGAGAPRRHSRPSR